MPELPGIDQREITVVEKPWGRFRQFTLNESTTVKIIEVEDAQVLSLQSHRFREELWFFLDDGGEVQIDDQILHPRKGEEVRIPVGAKHRLGSLGGLVRVLEISFGKFDEEDIARYEDKYGRVRGQIEELTEAH